MRFAITSQQGERCHRRRSLAIETGATYIFDKGYTLDSCGRTTVDAGGPCFGTRLRHNVHRREVAGANAAREAIARRPLSSTSVYRKPYRVRQ